MTINVDNARQLGSVLASMRAHADTLQALADTAEFVGEGRQVAIGHVTSALADAARGADLVGTSPHGDWARETVSALQANAQMAPIEPYEFASFGAAANTTQRQFLAAFAAEMDPATVGTLSDEQVIERTRAAVGAELEQLTRGNPADTTQEQLQRIGELVELPDSALPPAITPGGMNNGYTLLRAAQDGKIPAFERDVAGGIARVKLGVQRQRLLADPAVTRDTVTAELRRITALPARDVTATDVARLSELAGLPASHLPPNWNPLSWYGHTLFDDVAAFPESPATSANARAAVATVRRQLTREDLIASPTTSRASVTNELTDIVGSSSRELTHNQVDRLAVLMALPESLRPSTMPGAADNGRNSFEWYAAQLDANAGSLDDFFTRSLTERVDRIRTNLEREHIMNDPAQTVESLAADVRRIAAKPDSRITYADASRLAHIAGLPESKLPPVFSRLEDSDTFSDSMTDIVDFRELPTAGSDGASALDDLRAALNMHDAISSGSLTRASVLNELEALAHKPASKVTRRDMQRLRLLTTLPDELRPESISVPGIVGNSYVVEMAKSGMKPSTDGAAAILQGAIARVVRLERVATEPGLTQASATRELAALLARDERTLTRADMDRIDALSQLPDGLRPEGIRRGGAPISDVLHVIDGGWKPGAPAAQDGVLEYMRLALERSVIASDTSVTTESIARELQAISATPVDAITPAQVRRFALLTNAPQAVLPHSDTPWEDQLASRLLEQASKGILPTSDATVRETWNLATAAAHRSWLTSTPEGIAELRAQIAAGGAMDEPTLDALIASGVERVTAAGLNPRRMLDDQLALLTSIDTDMPEDMAAPLGRIARLADALASEAGAGQSHDVLTEIRGLAEKNRARIAGELTDGYPGYPEYTELGELQTLGEINRMMTASAPAATASRAGVQQATAATDIIRW